MTRRGPTTEQLNIHTLELSAARQVQHDDAAQETPGVIPVPLLKVVVWAQVWQVGQSQVFRPSCSILVIAVLHSVQTFFR